MAAEATARHYYDLFNERRLDEAEQLVDPQAVFHYVPTKQRLVGRTGYRALANGWINAFPDAHLEIRSIDALGENLVDVQLIGTGTHTGDLALGDAVVLAATGRRAQLPFQERLEIHDGRIIGAQLNFSLTEIRQHLMPSPGSLSKRRVDGSDDK